MQCLRLSLSADSNHAPAYNNLGILEMRLGHPEQARAFFQAAGSLAPYLFEPHHNYAKLTEKVKTVHEHLSVLVWDMACVASEIVANFANESAAYICMVEDSFFQKTEVTVSSYLLVH
jgi:hypothetical protein